ncbi:MAG TPA: helix-turn-helix domain-containing protein, partial [Polyangiaceae bacterium]
MSERRSYSQHCGLARALDVVGERWTLLVVRDLLLGPRRYGDLLGSLQGITTNLLAKRLRELTAAGLLEKRKLSPPASGEVYALTEAGLELEPVVMELARWGGRLLAHPRRGDRMDIGWALLSMKR